MRTTIVVLLLLCTFQSLFAQNRTVSGTITDQTGKGVPGVTVTVKGTKTGTQTDANGSYRISAPDNEHLSLALLVLNRKKLPLPAELHLMCR